MMTRYFKYFLVLLTGAVTFFILMETILRMLPVNTGLQMHATNSDYPFMHAYPNQKYTYSYGWAFSNTQHGETNNLGLPNSGNWNTNKPAVLVVGDSYIESLMNEYADTLQGKLGQAFTNTQVLSMAHSGANAADYLQMMAFAKKQLTLHALVFRIDSKDFLESIPGNAGSKEPGHSWFDGFDEKIRINLQPYVPSKLKELLRYSVLVCYLQKNLKFNPLQGIKDELNNDGKTMAMGKNNIQTASVAELRPVINFFLEQLPLRSGVPLKATVFVVDCNRKNIYSKWLIPTTFNDDNKDDILNYFSINAKAKGAVVVDMCPAMEEYVRQTRQRLDFTPMDYHWNPIGHDLAKNSVIPQLERILRE